MKAILLALLLLLSVVTVLSQTNVSGSQSGVWGTSGSPFVVVGNVSVPSGKSLEIQSGVTVTFVGSSYIRASSVTSTIQASGVTFVDGGRTFVH